MIYDDVNIRHALTNSKSRIVIYVIVLLWLQMNKMIKWRNKNFTTFSCYAGALSVLIMNCARGVSFRSKRSKFHIRSTQIDVASYFCSLSHISFILRKNALLFISSSIARGPFGRAFSSQMAGESYTNIWTISRSLQTDNYAILYGQNLQSSFCLTLFLLHLDLSPFFVLM